MSSSQHEVAPEQYRLRTAQVLQVHEFGCEIWDEPRTASIPFAPIFPSPRVERVSPGHLVAIAAHDDGREAIVWRWYDAVVLGAKEDGSVRLWEPGHGDVLALPRASFKHPEPGSRAYASAGLPGAEWWVTASTSQPRSDIDLDAVAALYTENDLWSSVFGLGS
jgi:hypothetical protein